MKIDSSEISVVVQGPIMGKPSDAYKNRLTQRTLESIRQHLPAAEIILSTWKGSDVAGLDFDILIENEDPGTVAYVDNPKFLYNVNRQLISTREGLKKASRKYALKFRSDSVLKGNEFLEYFKKYNKRNNEWKILKERVLMPTCFVVNPRREQKLFHPSDWFFFGYTEDVLNIWDIPLAPELEIARWFEGKQRPIPDVMPSALCRYTAEQYIWITFLRKHGKIEFDHLSDFSESKLRLSELIFANNVTILEPRQLCFDSLKYQLKITWDYHLMYTHSDWLRLYKKYCDNSLFLISIPFNAELLKRKIVRNLYFILIFPLRNLFQNPVKTFKNIFKKEAWGKKYKDLRHQ